MVNRNNTKAEILSEYQSLSKRAKTMKIKIPEEYSDLDVGNTKTALLSAVRSLELLIKDTQGGSLSTGDGDDKQLSLADIVYPKEKQGVEADKEPQNIVNDRPNVRDSHPVIEKHDFSWEGDEVKLLNQEILEKISSLEQAKKLREKEFKMLIELEEELEKLITELNVSKDRIVKQREQYKASIEEECKTCELRAEEVESRLDSKVEAAESQIEDFQEGKQNRIAERDKVRALENEQYSYELSVQQKREDDAWEDDSAKRKALIETAEEEIKKMQAEIKDKEETLPELRKRLEELPEQLDRARQEGEKDKQKEMEEEYAHQRAIIKMDHEASIRAMENKIKSLSEDYEALQAEKNIIQEKLDKAYDESNKLYLQTIQSTGGVRILSNFDKK